MFFSSFAVGITNPTAILTFLFAFPYFGITGKTGLLDGMLLVGITQKMEGRTAQRRM